MINIYPCLCVEGLVKYMFTIFKVIMYPMFTIYILYYYKTYLFFLFVCIFLRFCNILGVVTLPANKEEERERAATGSRRISCLKVSSVIL